MDHQGRQSSRQCRPDQFQAEGSRGAQPYRARLRARADRADGYMLPVQRWNAKRRRGKRWVTEKWKTRRGKVFLVPGDGPVGYRLPLGASLPMCRHRLSLCRAARSLDAARSLPTPEDLLPAADTAHDFATGRLAASRRARAGPGTLNEQTSAKSSGAVRTAMSVEPRDGRLCVFMPPVERSRTISNWSPLRRRRPRRSACRCTSRAMRRRTIHALNVMRVAPDPGVIEVNIHPASSWQECVDDHRGDL
jgi:uncharacterized protein (DUF2126 family)